MQIKFRLSIYFTILVGFLFLLFSISIYVLSKKNRQNIFYKKLEYRALTNAKLLIEVKEVDSTLLSIIDKNTTNELFDEDIIIYNDSLKLIYSNIKQDFVFVSKEEFEIIKTKKYFQKKINNKDLLATVFYYNNKNYIVIASAIDKYGLEYIKNLKITLIIVFFLSIIITLILSYFFAKSVLNPIKKIINQIQKISASRLNLRIEEGNQKDEIEILAISFNKMLDKLQSSFETQKLFFAGASHELRTPLTTLTGQIEVALLKNRNIEEYNEILTSLLEDIKSLNLLINNLLELAQTSVDFVDFNQNKIRIDEIIFNIKNDLKFKYPEKDNILNYLIVPEDEEFITVFGNENLLKVAFKNIIENAYKYSNNNTININIDFDDKYLKINIIDKGIGISKIDEPRIFEMFFRASNAKHFKGKGIGLTIVKKIIELHNGKISILSELNIGTDVTILIPNIKNTHQKK